MRIINDIRDAIGYVIMKQSAVVSICSFSRVCSKLCYLVFLRIKIYIEVFRLDEVPIEISVLNFVLPKLIILRKCSWPSVNNISQQNEFSNCVHDMFPPTKLTNVHN